MTVVQIRFFKFKETSAARFCETTVPTGGLEIGSAKHLELCGYVVDVTGREFREADWPKCRLRFLLVALSR